MLPSLAKRAGGPVVFVAEAAAACRQHGVDSTICATTLQSAFAPGARPVAASDLPQVAGELDVHLHDVRAPRRLAYAPTLGRELKQIVGRYHVVHIHSLWLYPQFAASHSARRARVPWLVTPHGALDPYLRQRGRLRKFATDVIWQRRMLSGAYALHVTTDAEATLIEDIAPQVPRAVLPLGIHVRRFESTGRGERFRRKHLREWQGPVVMFLGRVTSKKGLDVLIRAFARVLRSFPDAALAIVGPDDEGLTARLQRLSRDLQIAPQVLFTGPVYDDDRYDALKCADVWTLSSHTENFAIALLEALAAGCPTVISPAVNLAPQVSAAGAGVVSALSDDAFAAAITSLLSDAKRRSELTAAGRAFAARYDWANVSRPIASLYERIANGEAVSG